jgi:hypothetical protein
VDQSNFARDRLQVETPVEGAVICFRQFSRTTEMESPFRVSRCSKWSEVSQIC